MSTTNQLTQQEKQACIALSDIFLDIDHTSLDISYLSSSLRPLGIPVSTLERILRYDVFPILYPNLLSVAGVWTGFNEDLLLQELEVGRSSGYGWISSGVNAVAWYTIGTCAVWPVWVQVKKALNEGSDVKS
ncbi:hypothetical protein AN958_12399 [Leucoagaricus sp. SymC.cos]|nr:hypothetical protein AN958_12399 [Leucoagaricus sp. SymC.cos]